MALEVHIGLDDVDSPVGMCTTYVGALLYRELLDKGLSPLDLPYLVRLNPNIPFKTRGNGAVSLHFVIPREKLKWLKQVVADVLDKYAEHHGKTSPAAVIATAVPEQLRRLYVKALTDTVPLRYARDLAEDLQAQGLLDVVRFGRGLIGALASIGAFPLPQYTYELLLYRNPSETGPRPSEYDEILRIDRATRPLTFANIDFERRRVLALPHGPDPVIAGIRGFDYSLLVDLSRKYTNRWRCELWAVFKTNQGIGIHLRRYIELRNIRPYQSVRVMGYLDSNPKIIRGGHVIFKLRWRDFTVTCAVYKETGSLNRTARLLRKGDLIEVMGGVSPPGKRELTINVEVIRVLKVQPIVTRIYPPCPRCGKPMTSAGRNKGLKCRKCGFRCQSMTPKEQIEPRILEPGLYIQSPRAYRHLSLTARCLELTGGLGVLSKEAKKLMNKNAALLAGS